MELIEEDMDYDIPSCTLPIEEEYFLYEDFDHRGYISKYFEKRFNYDHHTQLLIHSNRVCVIALAPSHPIIRKDLNVISVNFQVSDKLNRTNNKVSGRGKRNAQNLDERSILCVITCENTKDPFTIRCGMVAKLLEVNSGLEKDPNLIKDSSIGYISAIFPRGHDFDLQVNKYLMERDYQVKLENENRNISAS